MNKHVIRGYCKDSVIAAAEVWIEERRDEWCEEWEMDDSVCEHRSKRISLKPYSINLWRVDDEE